MGRDISRRILKIFSNTTFDENLPSGTRVVLWGRTDRLITVTRVKEAVLYRQRIQ